MTERSPDADNDKVPTAEAGSSSPDGGSRWLLAMTCLAAVLITLDITVVNVALPQVAADLDAQLGDLQWVVNGYTLMFAALLLPAGSISDRIGRRPVFLVGVAVFTLASLVCGAAPSVGWLIAGRAIQGVGGALVLSTALALIAGAFTGRARQSAIGAFSAAGGADLGVVRAAGGGASARGAGGRTRGGAGSADGRAGADQPDRGCGGDGRGGGRAGPDPRQGPAGGGRTGGAGGRGNCLTAHGRKAGRVPSEGAPARPAALRWLALATSAELVAGCR
ncbi:MFS transporter [Streptomyces sp. NBC_00286]|uniref:MFS transporter n=1 Tax=Streptomyces sp. NBC_00286 TaxID=2975701 RepID=UPI002E2A4334|nr:MFS transporter [Streptomyces sp. NBC_00286]